MDGLIDLHLHLDGSLSLDTVKRLAKMQAIHLDCDDASLMKKLAADADCRDLNEYLTKFDFPLSLLQTSDAISESVTSLCRELSEQGLVYAEIRFAPQLHCRRGMTQHDVVRAAVDGLKRSQFRAALILCCMRGDNNRAENIETVNTAAEFLGRGVCALDLAGAEGLYPTERFADIFALAREKGIPFTIHAGEADGAESVRTAVRFGASRIGHGVRAAEDEELLRELAQKGITLELCPTSNLNTCVFSDISEYPIKRLIDAGVRVTVNTDNMTVSGTTVERELKLLADTFGLDDETVGTLLKNAENAAFCFRQN
jgi:adenosine deaminase